MPMPIANWLCCLIQRLIGRIADQGLIYVPRHMGGNGDPAAYDFTDPDLTTDGAWHDLDLTDIIPLDAESVIMHCHVADNLAGQVLQFRRPGNVNAILTADIETRVAAQVAHNVLTVACRNGIVEYSASAVAWTTIEIVIVGWYIPPS